MENRLAAAKELGVNGGMEWEVGVSRYKHLYIGGINNKFLLLYSTENYIQHPRINHNGKVFFKKRYV